MNNVRIRKPFLFTIGLFILALEINLLGGDSIHIVGSFLRLFKLVIGVYIILESVEVK